MFLRASLGLIFIIGSFSCTPTFYIHSDGLYHGDIIDGMRHSLCNFTTKATDSIRVPAECVSRRNTDSVYVRLLADIENGTQAELHGVKYFRYKMSEPGVLVIVPDNIIDIDPKALIYSTINRKPYTECKRHKGHGFDDHCLAFQSWAWWDEPSSEESDTDKEDKINDKSDEKCDKVSNF